MIRFSVLVALALSAAAPALARDAAKMPLVGVLRINTPATNEPGATMLRKALADVGDVDGHNLRLEFRLAEGHAERYPAMAERLVRDGASVIIAYGVPPVRGRKMPRPRSRSSPSPMTSPTPDSSKALPSQAATLPGSASSPLNSPRRNSTF